MSNEKGAGYHSMCGIGLDSLAGDWGAFVVPTIKQPFTDESIDQVTEWLEDNALCGKRGREYPTIIGKKTSGTLRVHANHRVSEFLYFAALGGADTFSGVADPYTHQLDKGEDIVRAMSIIIDKDPYGASVIKPWQIHGAMINKLTLTSSVTEGVLIELELIAQKITRDDTHRAALVALACGQRVARLFHNNMVLRMADTVDALAAGDIQKISEFSLSIDNKLVPDDRSSVSGEYIHQPIVGGKPDFILNFSIPRYEADTLLDAKDGGTLLQADIIYTGVTLGGGTYGTTIKLPTLYVKSLPAPVSGEEKIALVGMAQCYRNNGNTPMAAVTEEIQITLDNDNDAEITWTA